MKIFIATEAKIYLIDDRLYSTNSFRIVLKRYHDAFQEVILCSRIYHADISSLPGRYEEITSLVSETVNVRTLKEAALGKHDAEMRQQIGKCSLVVARVPSVAANHAAAIARKLHVPYLVEVVGCTWDSYWNYSTASKLLAAPSYLMMRRTVGKADYAVYVTEHFLQKRYPCHCPTISASNAIIDCSEPGVLEKRLRHIVEAKEKTCVLFTAAAIDVPYKGQEYVIRAMKLLLEKGLRVEYRLAGNGSPDRLQHIADECGVSNQVVFLGGLTRQRVMEELDSADIYIQPSLQEGLPRSVIEAMSRACPSLGAKTAGIPELIPQECIFRRADPADTAAVIEKMVRADRAVYAQQNYKKAHEYDQAVLQERRNSFYDRIKQAVSGGSRQG